MLIPVVLSGGHDESVSKGDLQFLLDIQQVIFLNVLMDGLLSVATKCALRDPHTMRKSDDKTSRIH